LDGTGLPALALGYVQGAEVMLGRIRRCRHSRRFTCFCVSAMARWKLFQSPGDAAMMEARNVTLLLWPNTSR
jgi:hypothetical protein